MYTRENLPESISLMLLAFSIPKAELHDLTIESINQGDGHGVWKDIQNLAMRHDKTFYEKGKNGAMSPCEMFNDSKSQLSFVMNFLR